MSVCGYCARLWIVGKTNCRLRLCKNIKFHSKLNCTPTFVWIEVKAWGDPTETIFLSLHFPPVGRHLSIPWFDATIQSRLIDIGLWEGGGIKWSINLSVLHVIKSWVTSRSLRNLWPVWHSSDFTCSVDKRVLISCENLAITPTQPGSLFLWKTTWPFFVKHYLALFFVKNYLAFFVKN